MEKEEWKIIPDAKDYEASSFGRIRNALTKKIIKTRTDKDGYQIITIYINKVEKTRKVHRLVASAFLENKDNLPQVNHKDENKSNNCISNLEWISIIDNNRYGTRSKRSSETLMNHKPNNGKKVICIETGEIFESCQEAANKKGSGNRSLIRNAIIRNGISAGYHWKYI